MPTIISASHYDTKVTIERDRSDLTIDELMDMFRNVAMSIGYHPVSWDNLIIEMAEEINENQKTNQHEETN
jgi:hypothetical protein